MSEGQQQPKTFKPLARQLERAVMTYVDENSRWALLRSRELVAEMRKCLDHIDSLLAQGAEHFLTLRQGDGTRQQTDEMAALDRVIDLVLVRRALGGELDLKESESDDE